MERNLYEFKYFELELGFDYMIELVNKYNRLVDCEITGEECEQLHSHIVEWNKKCTELSLEYEKMDNKEGLVSPVKFMFKGQPYN